MDQKFPQARPRQEEYHMLSRFWIERSIKKDFIDAPEGADRFSLILNAVRQRFEYLFQDKKTEFEKLISDLGSASFNNDDEMLKAITGKVFEFANANFTREELEKRYGEPAYRGEDKIDLNEIMDCNIDKDNPNELKVHLKATSLKGPQMIRDGLRSLAEKLSTEPKLKDIEIITVTSYIVTLKPEIIERLGFVIMDPTDKEKFLGDQRGEMHREEFVKRYLKKN